MLDLAIADTVATITLSHPPVNALSREWADAFHRHLDTLEGDEEWRVLLLRSSCRHFSAGGDLKAYAGRLDGGQGGVLLQREAAYYQGLFRRIESSPRISVAEISGACLGGGFELALACDLRIAALNARIGLPEVGVGLLPAAGGTQRTARLVGEALALRLVAGAEVISGADALAYGLVQWTFAAEELEASARAIASRLASQPREAVLAAKRCIRAALDPAVDGYSLELEAVPALMDNDETRRRILAFVKT